MYVDEIKHITSCIQGKQKNDLINLKDAQKTLNISLAIKKSGKIGQVVSI